MDGMRMASRKGGAHSSATRDPLLSADKRTCLRARIQPCEMDAHSVSLVKKVRILSRRGDKAKKQLGGFSTKLLSCFVPQPRGEITFQPDKIFGRARV